MSRRRLSKQPDGKLSDFWLAWISSWTLWKQNNGNIELKNISYQCKYYCDINETFHLVGVWHPLKLYNAVTLDDINQVYQIKFVIMIFFF